MRVLLLATSLSSPAHAEQGVDSAFDNNGEDITRPEPETKIELRLEQRESDANGGTERELLQIRMSGIFDLKSVWGMSWFAQLPFVRKATGISGAGSDSGYGIDDIQLQALLYRPLSARWAYGAGMNVVVPSAGDSLGGGKWQLRPIAGVRYAFLDFGPNTWFVPKIRYAISIGGDASRRNISEAQIAPTLNIGLPDRWFLTLYPSQDIRINFGEPVSGQTGRLFIPFDAEIGRKLGDDATMSFEIGFPIVRDYPIYNLKARLRVAARF